METYHDSILAFGLVNVHPETESCCWRGSERTWLAALECSYFDLTVPATLGHSIVFILKKMYQFKNLHEIVFNV